MQLEVEGIFFFGFDSERSWFICGGHKSRCWQGKVDKKSNLPKVQFKKWNNF
jgi:hypothetical protein